MNTPAHVVINLMALGRKAEPRLQGFIVTGALLPDIPMFLFYFVVKIIQRVPEREIWDTLYYQDGWQTFFDTFNSVPLIAVGMLIAWRLKARGAQLLFSSMAVHVALDLPLHHEDAHRHFFPLSDWRFSSPVSYYDPAHYGHFVLPIEALLVAVCTVLLYRGSDSRAGRIIAGAAGGVYLAFIAFALIVWGGSG